MKRARFSEEQIIGVLKEAEAGAKVSELCRRHGISDATFYTWRAKYGGREIAELRRLRQLEEEVLPGATCQRSRDSHLAPALLLGRNRQCQYSGFVYPANPVLPRHGPDRLRLRPSGSKWLEPLPPFRSCMDSRVYRLTLCNLRIP